MNEDTKEALKAFAWLYLGCSPFGVMAWALCQWHLIEAFTLLVLGFWFFVKEVEPRIEILRGGSK